MKKKDERTTQRKFVIYEDVAKEVVTMLEAYIDHIDAECARTGCMCDLRGDPCSQSIKTTLHHFESGLCLYKEKKKRNGK